MSMYTRCPHCDTYFRVSREQLQASSGQVRCGRCERVFDAFATLTSQLPAPAGENARLPTAPPSQPAPSPTRDAAPAPVPAPKPAPNFSRENSEVSADRPVYSAASETSSASVPEPEILTLPDDLFGHDAGSRRRWPWIAGSLILIVTLIAQALFFLATDVAVRFPEFRPELTAACQWLHCTVAMPRMADQLFIEASDLQVLNPARPGEVLLTASIRNRATVTQELPLIELTLTDALNQTTARKVFYPADYMDKSQNLEAGIGANQEIPVKLYLDTGDVKPSGYRLYLFFG
jgi:predicted Zn finger-like uncharacterized protein